MSTITLMETDYAILWYHPEAKIIHHHFYKFNYGQHLRSLLETGLNALKQHGAQKWLSDDRNSSALPQSDIDWSLTDWIPKMIDNGWKYWAVVLPDKIVGKATMQRVIDAYTPLGITIQVFDDPDLALQWLESV